MHLPVILPRSLPILPLVALLASGLGAPTPAGADFPNPDQVFLDTQTSVLQGHRDETLASGPTPTAAMNAIHGMLVSRRVALAELGNGQPLRRFDEIETQDTLDKTFARILDEIAYAGILADTTMPAQELGVRFAQVMGSPPDMGKNPLAFMAIGMAEIATITVDSLRADPTFPNLEADKLALRLIHSATQAHISVYDDMMLRSGAEAFRQKSVIGRMLCEEGYPYKIMNQKNKLHGSGEISTMYYLNCQTGEPFVAEFYLEAASKLNKVADRQKLTAKPTAASPSPGLDP